MFDIGDGFFLETPTKSKTRILHPAKILGTKEGGYTAEIEEADVPLDERAEFLIYFEVKTKFVKQAATVEAVCADEPNSIIEFVTVGEPAAAESREYFRVSTITLDRTATLGEQTDCKLLNVSATGFSVLSTSRFDIGSMVNASISDEGKSYSGRVCVQSIRLMDKDQIRYGLYCVDGKGSNDDLATGLPEMAIAIQRDQLRLSKQKQKIS